MASFLALRAVWVVGFPMAARELWVILPYLKSHVACPLNLNYDALMPSQLNSSIAATQRLCGLVTRFAVLNRNVSVGSGNSLCV